MKRAPSGLPGGGASVRRHRGGSSKGAHGRCSRPPNTGLCWALGWRCLPSCEQLEHKLSPSSSCSGLHHWRTPSQESHESCHMIHDYMCFSCHTVTAALTQSHSRQIHNGPYSGGESTSRPEAALGPIELYRHCPRLELCGRPQSSSHET